MPTPLIRFDHVSFQFRDQPSNSLTALRDISLTIEPGEYIALVGANGSGKTTLVRHLNGILIPTAGMVRIAGLSTNDSTNLSIIRQTVGMVFQFPEDQIIATSVEEDVAFGLENLGVPSAQIRERMEKALMEVDLLDQRKRSPHLLSAGQTQRLALAGVLAMDPQCIVFDEATTMLDPRGRRMALDTLKRLHLRGKTILTITHHMEEAAEAERVIVLKGGRVLAQGSPSEIFGNAHLLDDAGLEPPAALLAARRFHRVFPSVNPHILREEELLRQIPKGNTQGAIMLGKRKTRGRVNSPILVNVDNISYTYLKGTPMAHPALHGVSLKVPEKRTHGLLGATGSGKTTLLQHINGVLRADSGTVRVGPFDLTNPQVDVLGLCRIAALVFQIPEQHFFEQYVGDEIAFGPRQFFPAKPPREAVRLAMIQVGLDFETDTDRFLSTLSGGQKRKVALAAALACQPELLLLDEPTAGLDPASRKETLYTLQEFQASEKGLIISSHCMEDLAVLTDDLSVFDRGRIIAAGETGEIFSQTEMLDGAGLEPPLALKVITQMRRKGWEVPQEIWTLDGLFDFLSIHETR